jgi:YD repeat-containing protein
MVSALNDIQLPQMNVTYLNGSNSPGFENLGGIENLNVIPSNANFYGIDTGANVHSVSGATLAGASMVGDVLATTEFPGICDVIYYSNGKLVAAPLTITSTSGNAIAWEQTTVGTAPLDSISSTSVPLAGRTVYIDLTNSGYWQSGDPTTITDVEGDYDFPGLASGQYTVAQGVPEGWIQVVPTEPSYQVTLTAGENTVGIDFSSEMGTSAPDHPPIFTSTPTPSVVLGQQYRYTFSAYDPDPGDTITYDLPEHPEGMYIDYSIPGQATIVWNVPADDTEFGRFLLRATDNRGLSAIQPFTIGLESTVPAPVIEASAASSSSITVSWTTIPGAYGYFLQRSEDSNFTGMSSIAGSPDWQTLVADGGGLIGNEYIYTDTGLQPGITYYYRVEAEMSLFISGVFPLILTGNSNVASATTFPTSQTVPAKPTGVAAALDPSGGIDLEWEANTDGITQTYEIYRNSTNNFSTSTVIASVLKRSPTGPVYYYYDPSGTASSYYWVVADASTNGTGPFSAPSDVASVTIAPPPANGPTVNSVTVSSNGVSLSPNNTVISTSAQLTGNVTDPISNDTSLTYQWALLSAPTRATVSFTDGQNTEVDNLRTSAQTIIADFNVAGQYLFALTAQNSAGSSSQYDFSVTVEQNPTTISISPQVPVILTSSSTMASTEQFEATVNDQFGNAIQSPSGLTWSNTADLINASPQQGDNAVGTINAQTGLYSAGPLVGADILTVTIQTLTGASISASTQIGVNASASYLQPVNDLQAIAISQTTIELTFSAEDLNGNAQNNGSALYEIIRTNPDGTTSILPGDSSYTSSDPYYDMNLTPGATYQYSVELLDENDILTAPSNIASATTWAVPTPPQDVVATTLSATQVEITWDDNRASNPGIAGWEVWEATGTSTVPTSTFSPVSPGEYDIVAEDTEQGLNPSTDYWFEVRSVNSSDGEPSAFSVPVEAATLAESAPPPTPADLTAAYAGEGRVGLQWSPVENDPALLGYDIYRSTQANFTPTADLLIGSSANAFYTNDGVETDQTYYYEVVAVNDSGLGNGSEIDSAPTPWVAVNTSTVAAPTAPSMPTATVSGSNVALTWSDSAANEAGFEIEREPSTASNAWGLEGQVTQFQTMFTDQGVPPGSYSYEIVAYNFGSCGVQSAASPILTPVSVGGLATTGADQPTTPTVSAAWINGQLQVSLTTTDPTSPTPPNDNAVTGYYIYRGAIPEDSGDGSSIVWTQLNSNPLPAGSDSNRTLSYTDTAVDPGVTYYYKVQAIMPDDNALSQFSGSAPVTTPYANSGEAVAITNLDPSPSIDPNDPQSTVATVNGVTDVYGIVRLINGDPTAWTLTLTPTGNASGIIAATPITVASGAGPAGSEGQGALLGALDPSLYPSGSYLLTLTATDQNTGTSVSTPAQQINLFDNVQLGTFTLPVTDLTFDVPGQQPIVISRTYDSSQAGTESDLGYGWQFNISNTDLNTTATTTARSNGTTSFKFGDLVYITVPGGPQHVFQFMPLPTSFGQNGGDAENPLDPDSYVGSYYCPQFICVDGSGATLAVQSSTGDNLTNSANLDNYTLQYDASTGEFYEDTSNGQAPYNPADVQFGGNYVLTTSNGTSYTISASSGQVETSKDANGNVTTYSSGQPTEGGYNVSYQTNNEGLVTQATVELNGAAVESVYYSYDTNKQLISVSEPVAGAPGASDATTKFTYTYDSAGHHLLTQVADALGVVVATATYDPATGELTKLTNANTTSGATIQTPTDYGDGATQVVNDPDGGQTENVYDQQGNVVREIQTLYGASNAVTGYLVTVHSYNYGVMDVGDAVSSGTTDENELISETDYQPFEISGADLTGLRYTETPSNSEIAKQVSYYTAADDNNDPDNIGQVQTESIAGPNGMETTTFGNYVDSQPETITAPNPSHPSTYITTSNSYNSSGDLISTVSPIGITTSYTYTNGDDGVPAGLLLTTTTQAAGDASATLVSRNVYYGNTNDPANGVVAIPPNGTWEVGQLANTTTYDGASSQTTYFGYDQFGNQTLDYTWKTWTNPDGSQTSGWVGTTTTFNVQGQVVSTSQGVYVPTSSYTSQAFPTIVSTGNVVINSSDAAPFSSFNGGLPLTTSQTSYNAAGQVQTTTDSYNGPTLNVYDANGNVIETIYSDGTEVRSVYDSMNRLIWQTDRYSSSTYNAATQTYSVPDNTTTAMATETIYNTLGQVIETIRASGVLISINDSNGGPINQVTFTSSSAPASYNQISESQTFYNAEGEAAETVSASGLHTGTIYNPDGSVQYTGPLLAGLTSDPANTSIFNGTAWYNQPTPSTLSTLFASDTQYLYNQEASTTTSAIFVMPAMGTTVSVTVGSTSGFAVGQYVDVLSGTSSDDGLVVSSIANSTTLVLLNLGYDLSSAANTHAPGNSVGSGASVTAVYDQVIDPNGHWTDTYQDNQGRVVFTLHQDGEFTQTLYSQGDHAIPGFTVIPVGGSSAVLPTIPTGGSETIQIAQRKATDPAVSTIDIYDAAGNLVDVWEPPVVNGATGQMVNPQWTYIYDASGDETAQIAPNAQQAYQAWLAETASQQAANPFTDQTTFAYDQNGNKVRELLPDGEMQTWSYDAHGNLVLHKVYNQTNGVTNSTASQTIWDIYDTTNDGHGGQLDAEYRYSSDFTPTGTTLAYANSTNYQEKTLYTYDSLGRQSTVTDYTNSGGTATVSTSTQYTYDTISGNEASITTPDGTIDYSYNEATGLLQETTTSSNDTFYYYNALGQLADVYSLKLNGTPYATYTGPSATTGLSTFSGTPLTTVYTYDPAGNLSSVTDPNGMVTTYFYDDENRLTSEMVVDGSNELFSAQYQLYDDGQRENETDTRYSSGSTVSSQIEYTWTYDNANRLMSEQLQILPGSGSGVPTPYTDTYTYDLDGNRTKETQTSGGTTSTTTYIYNADNEMTSSTQGSTTTTYGYDANGSQTTTTVGSTLTQTNYYDVRNRLQKVVNSNGTTTYVYDDAGDRVQETTGSTTTYYLIDSNNPTGYAKPIEVRVGSATGTPTTTYILGLDVIGQANSSGAVSYLVIDGRDDTRALVSSSGAVTATFNYDAFGNPVGFTAATAPTVFLFQQQMFDAPSGLNFFDDGVREEELGAPNFIEADPPGHSSNNNPITLNSYLLDNADAINVVDPSGHDGIDDLLVAMGVATEIGLALLNSTVVTALVQSVAVVSLVEFAINPDFQQSIIAATGGDLTNLTEVFSGGVSYFANLGTVGRVEAENTAAFVSSFAPAAAQGSDAVVLDVAGMRNFFLARGLSENRAIGFADSFTNGMGVLREVKAGETFLRYSDQTGNTAGYFLTKTAYDSPGQAVSALNLGPYNNGATLVQQVTATQNTYVLEGGVEGGASDAYQAIAVDQSAFTYGPRVTTGSNPP